jgi:membrane fusion protein, multidrug efflux system
METQAQKDKAMAENTGNSAPESTAPEKPKSKKKRLFIFLGIAILVVGGFAYMRLAGMGHETTDNAQLDAMITPVRNIVPGFVTDIKFGDNETVRKGDTLLMIDQADYKTRVAFAEAALESAQAQLEVAKSGVNVARSNASASSYSSQAAKDNIVAAQARFTKNEKEIARLEKMLADGAATQQQFEVAKAEYEASKGQLDMLKKQYEASSSQAAGAHSQADGQASQINLAIAAVKLRESELKLAQTQLSNTVIVAPFDGVISKRAVQIGQYLASGTPICSAVDQSHLWVTANFKETQIEDMRPGQAVDIHVDAFPSAKISGKLESFGGATGAKYSLLPPDNSTGNFVKITQRVPVRIAIVDSPRDMAGLLMPGLSVTVDVHTK